MGASGYATLVNTQTVVCVFPPVVSLIAHTSTGCSSTVVEIERRSPPSRAKPLPEAHAVSRMTDPARGLRGDAFRRTHSTNDELRPVLWAKTADQILASVARFCQATLAQRDS